MNTGKRLGTLCLLLTALLALSACARLTKGPAFPRSKPAAVSPEAKATFNYLKHLELQREGKTEKALQALRQASEQAPSPQLYLELARSYWEEGRPDKARETIKAGLQKFPGQGDLVRHLARLSIEQDRLDNATSLLSVYLRKHGGDPQTVADLAQIFLREERYAKARELLQSVPKDRRTPQIHYLLGQTYLEQGRPERAIPDFRASVEADPNYLQAWAQLGYAREESGDYAQAKQAYSVLLNKGSQSGELRLKLIDLELKLNNPDRAMSHVRQGPSSRDFLFRASAIFLQSEFYGRAEEALDLLPNSALDTGRGLYYRAVISLRLDEAPRKALDLLDRIPASSEIHQDGLLLKARILFDNRDTDKALQAARQGRREHPTSSAFWLLESRILLEREDPAQARKILRRGLDNVSSPLDLWSQLAIVEHELGNTEAALRHMRRLLDEDPENASALNFIGYTLVEQERDLEKGGRLIRQALQLDPGNPYYLDSLAWYQFKADEPHKAWETIQKAVAQVRKDPTLWEHYADIARSLDKREEAREGYERALELNPDNPGALRDKLTSIHK